MEIDIDRPEDLKKIFKRAFSREILNKSAIFVVFLGALFLLLNSEVAMPPPQLFFEGKIVGLERTQTKVKIEVMSVSRNGIQESVIRWIEIKGVPLKTESAEGVLADGTADDFWKGRGFKMELRQGTSIKDETLKPLRIVLK